MDFLGLLKAEKEKAKAKAAGGQSLGSASSSTSSSRNAAAATAAATAIKGMQISDPDLFTSLLGLDRLYSSCECRAVEPRSEGCLYYLANAISTKDADLLSQRINSERHEAAWTCLRQRRLQHWGKIPGGVSGQQAHDTQAEEEGRGTSILPQWLQQIADQFEESLGISPLYHDARINNVLINEYLPPIGGIMHHTDGPCYLPHVFVLSLGGPALLSFQPRLAPEQVGVVSSAPLCTVLLEPNSLFVFKGAMYTDHLHGIQVERDVDILGEDGVPCVNLDLLAGSGKEEEEGGGIGKYVYGSRVERSARTSLTFRCVVAREEGGTDGSSV